MKQHEDSLILSVCLPVHAGASSEIIFTFFNFKIEATLILINKIYPLYLNLIHKDIRK